jgi:hypothetical protein
VNRHRAFAERALYFNVKNLFEELILLGYAHAKLTLQTTFQTASKAASSWTMAIPQPSTVVIAVDPSP